MKVATQDERAYAVFHDGVPLPFAISHPVVRRQDHPTFGNPRQPVAILYVILLKGLEKRGNLESLFPQRSREHSGTKVVVAEESYFTQPTRRGARNGSPLRSAASLSRSPRPDPPWTLRR